MKKLIKKFTGIALSLTLILSTLSTCFAGKNKSPEPQGGSSPAKIFKFREYVSDIGNENSQTQKNGISQSPQYFSNITLGNCGLCTESNMDNITKCRYTRIIPIDGVPLNMNTFSLYYTQNSSHFFNDCDIVLIDKSVSNYIGACFAPTEWDGIFDTPDLLDYVVLIRRDSILRLTGFNEQELFDRLSTLNISITPSQITGCLYMTISPRFYPICLMSFKLFRAIITVYGLRLIFNKNIDVICVDDRLSLGLPVIYKSELKGKWETLCSKNLTATFYVRKRTIEEIKSDKSLHLNCSPIDYIISSAFYGF